MKKILLLDLDDTILDFSKTEFMALVPVLEMFNIAINEENLDLYSKINLSYWKRLEKGELTREEVITKRWDEFFSHFNKTVDSSLINKAYFNRLKEGGYLLDDAKDFLKHNEDLKRFDLYIITNGVKEIQTNRIKISGILPYFKGIYISEDIGYVKPDKRFFDYIIKENNLNRDEILVIGDSLTSDIQGAINSNLDYFLYDPDNKHQNVEKRITSLMELFNVEA